MTNYFDKSYHIVENRGDCLKVMLMEFMSDINKCNQVDGYGFLKVLKADDRDQFVVMLSAKERLECYKRRAIQLSTWITVMNSLKLKSSYAVYRIAYWGETIGKSIIYPKLTKYVLPLWRFQMFVDEKSYFKLLIQSFGMLSLFTPHTNILLDIDKHHMKKLDNKYSRSSWHNTDYKVPDDYYGG